MTTFKIGLVTVLFNSDEVLEGFFRSLSEQTFKEYNLYIIDNTPNKVTDELIRKYVERYPISLYTHIKNLTNVGVAKGNNQGIKLSLASGATHTLLLNNDIEFLQIELFNLIYKHAILSNETLITPQILYYDTRKIWMAGGILQHFKGTNIHVGDNQDGDAYNEPRYFDYAPTCFLLINNNVFKEIGLMDERYFVYYDDVDFIYRAGKAGNKVYYMPSLKVLHKVSSSTGGTESLFSIYYSNRNRIYFLKKNYKGLSLCIPLLFTLLTRVVKYFKYRGEERKKLYQAVMAGLKM